MDQNPKEEMTTPTFYPHLDLRFLDDEMATIVAERQEASQGKKVFYMKIIKNSNKPYSTNMYFTMTEPNTPTLCSDAWPKSLLYISPGIQEVTAGKHTRYACKNLH
jgi:hypothetical protein